MIRSRPARLLVLLGLVALAGLVVARRRRHDADTMVARPAAAPDGVASEPVTDDGDAAIETAPDDTADAPAPAPVEPVGTDADEPADEPVTVSARVYAAPEPDVVDEPSETTVTTDDPTGDPTDDDEADTTVATDDATDEAAAEPAEPAEPDVPSLDLARIERDLEGVEAALRRLDEGTYWTDEITGEPLDEALLAADPVARRNVA